ncbi:MAG: VCBS repeat-containing protein [Spirochaetes bacterium]|nr:VCBS repeat-containing protein [Spirochaetota bacterium]
MKRAITISFFIATALLGSCFNDNSDNKANNTPGLLGYKPSLFSMDAIYSESLSRDEINFGVIGRPSNYNETIKTFTQEVAKSGKVMASVPSSFNWADQGVVTVAKNQGSCGSCWAFTVAGALESKILINGGPLYDLSELQQVLCNTDQRGCNGGWMTAFQYWYDVGPTLESCTGYNFTTNTCSDISSCPQLQYRTFGYYTVDTNNINDMKASLLKDGPGWFEYFVYSDFIDYWYYGSSGEVYTNTSSTYKGFHAVLIIGWDDSKGAWLCKNSWGTYAGPNNDGTFWIAYSGHASFMNFGMANVQIISNYNTSTLFGTNYHARPEYHNSTSTLATLRDMNGDGLPDYIAHFNFNTNEYGLWVAINNWSGFNEPINWESAQLFGTNYYAAPEYGNKLTELRDMNGDGLPDYIAHYNYNTSQYGLWVAINNGSGFYTPANWGSAQLFGTNYYARPEYHNSEGNTLATLRDMNGDGLPDYIAHYNFNTNQYGLWVAINNGSGFDAPANWGTAQLFGTNNYAAPQYGDKVTELRDMNGDGLPDYLAYYNYNTSEHGMWVAINNGSGFEAPVNWGTVQLFGSTNYAMPKWGEYSEVRDVNGDGLPDYLAYYNYNTSEHGMWVAINNGSGFNTPANWGTAQLLGSINYAKPQWGEKYSELRDMNGDGLPDYLAYYNYNTSEHGMWVAINNGSGFDAPANWGTSGVFGSTYFSMPQWGTKYSEVRDINGDGLPDYLAHYNYNTSEYGLWVLINNGEWFNIYY